MEISYSDTAKGYLARPKNPNGAGVVVIHEFWGLTTQIKKTADKISGEGFTVLAVDLYEGKVAKTREGAQELKKSITESHAIKHLEAACAYLQREWGIPPKKIVLWGFCFGGGIAFQAAVYPIKTGGTIIYYGPVSDDAELIDKIGGPIIGVFGGQDKSITSEMAQRFHQTLHKGKKIHEIYIYPEVGHAFANEERETYHETSAKDAWKKTITFLNKYVAKPA
ncbi:MAG: hypothetical protein A3C07_02180 [Candidatus Sungbacteria bacterium RIFCSPHIGHO2_02_FULL_47_11]|uniref:Dienelactone hydrolase domain-containing protein n=1 Tax=Candidatus Sungbacteria bacterium RIFCSPHIGHO2_02_FULL_47_11 TaxID=1802270 RepID=A0A1G2KMJ7_9BACT|nr:MAG: hypothetical protein A3C07_02180 [Candidatus Sungbacteria bacterium RIFCSPHIGHO2_02_FULL_47_11]